MARRHQWTGGGALWLDLPHAALIPLTRARKGGKWCADAPAREGSSRGLAANRGGGGGIMARWTVTLGLALTTSRGRSHGTASTVCHCQAPAKQPNSRPPTPTPPLCS